VCRVACAEFDAIFSAPAKARRFVSERLQRWELGELVDTATLLTSELVSNAVMHANTGPSVVVAVADGVLEVGVSDHNPDLPPRPPPLAAPFGLDSEAVRVPKGGRGILLVDLLADQWGATPVGDGKQVWYQLQATEWSYRTACICHADHLDRVRLQSGRWALGMPGPWDNP
jgi:anti-sigma regulatory factor (Ser/Thr protein kinase)